jgi:hypothetical protein
MVLWRICPFLSGSITMMGRPMLRSAPYISIKPRFRYKIIVIDSDLDPNRHQPRLGDVVYFVGLLANIKSMHVENVPMVRSGTLGRMFQRDVRIKWPDATIHSMVFHLIDCHSHQGFSGSPCYVQPEPRGRDDITSGGHSGQYY